MQDWPVRAREELYSLSDPLTCFPSRLELFGIHTVLLIIQIVKSALPAVAQFSVKSGVALSQAIWKYHILIPNQVLHFPLGSLDTPCVLHYIFTQSITSLLTSQVSFLRGRSSH